MALTTDRMSVASQPNQWRTRAVVCASATLASCKLILQPRGIPVRELPPAAGTGAIANADLCDVDPEFPGRSVSATRAPPLLDFATQPRNVLDHVLRVGRDGGGRVVRVVYPSNCSTAAGRHRRDRRDLLFRLGLAQSLAVRAIVPALIGLVAGVPQ